MADIEYQYNIIYIGEKTYCILDWDILKQNITFLESIDFEYFLFIAENLEPFFTSRTTTTKVYRTSKFRRYTQKSQKASFHDLEIQRAAIQLRTTYFHALETLFTLISAMLQAPICVYGWIQLSDTRELKNIIRNINEYKTFPMYLKNNWITWEKISELILSYVVFEDSQFKTEIVNGFSGFFTRLAHEFVSPAFSDEYNSIKHGFRIRSGGHTLQIGIQEKMGVPAKAKDMRVLDQSEFGCSYLIYEKLNKGKRHYQFFRNHNNWSPDNLLWSLKLTSMAINNIISWLLINNGKNPEDVKFFYPDNTEIFKQAWISAGRVGNLSFSMKRKIISEIVIPFTEKEMKERYFHGKALGNKQVNIDNDGDE